MEITSMKEATFVNSLGMAFVNVPKTTVLFCVWETRIKDYSVYVLSNSEADRYWQNSYFAQEDEHPIVNVSWEDAKAFCQWLTVKERREGLIRDDQEYRLPIDEEWSWAVGLPEETGNTPKDKSGKIKELYPWGREWPPLKGAGNYAQSLHCDNYEHTSPVGRFNPNIHGLYDMGGNVWEWCEDWYDNEHKHHVLRGASWFHASRDFLLSSIRIFGMSNSRNRDFGFRVVLGISSP